MNNLKDIASKLNEANMLYEKQYSSDQKHVLNKIDEKILNYGKLQLLEHNKIKFDSFLLLLMFQAFVKKHMATPKFRIRPAGRATYIEVWSKKTFDTLLNLGFPMKLSK